MSKFTVINGTIYSVEIPKDYNKNIVLNTDIDMSNVDIIYENMKLVKICKNIDLRNDPELNDKNVEWLKNKIISEKIKDIDIMIDLYRVYFDYEILDKDNFICGGIIICEPDIKNAVNLQNLTEDNRLIYNYEKYLHAKFNIDLISREFDIMNKMPNKDLTLHVKRITLVAGLNNEETFYQYYNKFQDTITHDITASIPDDTKKDTITIYDSNIHGKLDNCDFNINSDLIKHISYDINIILNNYIDVSSKDEILELLKQNNEYVENDDEAEPIE